MRANDDYLLPFSCIKLNMVRHVGGHGLRDTPAKGRRGRDGVDAEAQEAGADPFPYKRFRILGKRSFLGFLAGRVILSYFLSRV